MAAALGGILSIPVLVYFGDPCPWGRLGSVLYTCKRLRRIRRRFKHFWPILSLSSPLGLAIFWPRFASVLPPA